MELSDRLEGKFRLDENQKKALRRLKLFSVHDLLFHFPVRYSDISDVKQISELEPNQIATIYGKVFKLKTKKGYHSKIPMAEGEIEDMTGKIKIIWFNQAYLAKMIKNGDTVKLTGKVTDVVNLRFTNITTTLNSDRLDRWAVCLEYTFNAFAMGHFAHGEC